MLNMLKKKLGVEAIERVWENWKHMSNYFKIPSTLSIPEGCKKINIWAFYCCERLRKVVIPKSVERIEDYAFYCCKNAEIILKKCREDFESFGEYISPNAFLGCKKIGYVKKEIRS